jgi:hypothetical protein
MMVSHQRLPLYTLLLHLLKTITTYYASMRSQLCDRWKQFHLQCVTLTADNCKALQGLLEPGTVLVAPRRHGTPCAMHGKGLPGDVVPTLRVAKLYIEVMTAARVQQLLRTAAAWTGDGHVQCCQQVPLVCSRTSARLSISIYIS